MCAAEPARLATIAACWLMAARSNALRYRSGIDARNAGVGSRGNEARIMVETIDPQRGTTSCACVSGACLCLRFASRAVEGGCALRPCPLAALAALAALVALVALVACSVDRVVDAIARFAPSSRLAASALPVVARGGDRACPGREHSAGAGRREATDDLRRRSERGNERLRAHGLQRDAARALRRRGHRRPPSFPAGARS